MKYLHEIYIFQTTMIIQDNILQTQCFFRKVTRKGYTYSRTTYHYYSENSSVTLEANKQVTQLDHLVFRLNPTLSIHVFFNELYIK